MTHCLTNASIDFLWELSLHNERPWFLEHKQQFEEVLLVPFKELAHTTADLAQQRWPQRDFGLHISRIYRDARRLFGRGPYKDNLWFSLQKGDARARGPMLWFEVNREGTSHGVGFWDRTAQQAEAFRKKLDREPARFEKIIKNIPDPGKMRLWGEEYKRPKGNPSPLLSPFYNRKQASAGYENHFGQGLFQPDLPQRLADSFAGLMPLYDFFREGYEESLRLEN